MRNEAPEGEERILHTLLQSESLMLGALLLLLPVCVCVFVGLVMGGLQMRLRGSLFVDSFFYVQVSLDNMV